LSILLRHYKSVFTKFNQVLCCVKESNHAALFVSRIEEFREMKEENLKEFFLFNDILVTCLVIRDMSKDINLCRKFFKILV